MKKFFYTFLFIVLILASNGIAIKTFAMGSSSDEVPDSGKKLEKSECGKTIEEFKKFQVLARHCDRDTDCTVLDGLCPLGCNFYVNKIFTGIFVGKLSGITEVCGEMTCSSECRKKTSIPVCNHKKCMAGK